MDKVRMRRQALLGVAVLAAAGGSMIGVANGASGDGEKSENQGGNRYVIGAWLNADQEVPFPQGTLEDASGKYEVTLRRQGSRWRGTGRLDYEGLSGPAVAAHIHMGAKGVAGPVQVGLCGVAATPGCSDGVRTPLDLSNAQVNALRRGSYYVNVHTAQNPPGEIRGQLGQVYRINASLTRGQARPRPRGARGATGRLRGTLVTYGNEGHLDTTLTYRRLTGRALSASINAGARGRIGATSAFVCGGGNAPACTSGVKAEGVELRGSIVRSLLRGRSYVNIRTNRNKTGEIRGQIRARR